MPTTDSSSPTATRAVKEKRRPPLTTLATRLISITRSWRSSPRGLTVSTLVVLEPFMAAVQGSGDGSSETQPLLPGALGESLNAAVVLVAATIKDAGGDARLAGPLGQQLSGPL